MKKTSKCVVSILMFTVVVLGVTTFFSLNRFIKPVAWQIIYGYSANISGENVGVNDKIRSVLLSIENIFSDTEQKYTYVTINGLFNKIINKSTIDDAEDEFDVIKLSNGHLTFTVKSPMEKSYADSVARLDKFVSANGGELVYIQAPGKISRYESLLPPGINDFSNKNADLFLRELDEYNVATLDLRQEMHNQGLDQYDYFFKTDLHWTPQAGFWAFQNISKKLSNEYGFTLDTKSMVLDNYNVKIHEDVFLGTMGRRVGKIYAGIDDFAEITPAFKTELTLSSPKLNINTHGTFEDVLLNYSQLEIDDMFNSYPYGFYTKNHDDITILKNNMSPNNKKILFVHDSFSAVVSPFLILNCSELHLIDLRGFEVDQLAKYINTMKPDVVLLMYYTGMVDQSEMYRFGL